VSDVRPRLKATRRRDASVARCADVIVDVVREARKIDEVRGGAGKAEKSEPSILGDVLRRGAQPGAAEEMPEFLVPWSAHGTAQCAIGRGRGGVEAALTSLRQGCGALRAKAEGLRWICGAGPLDGVAEPD
jgi:hypothetical protein